MAYRLFIDHIRNPVQLGFDIKAITGPQQQKASSSSSSATDSLDAVVKHLCPPLPSQAPDGLLGMRALSGIRRFVAEEGGAAWSHPLVFGVDPLFDRIDFRENQKGQVAYVGDCVRGGWRHP
jgi:hypothetical protein